jgi:hypothetical protein
MLGPLWLPFIILDVLTLRSVRPRELDSDLEI